MSGNPFEGMELMDPDDKPDMERTGNMFKALEDSDSDAEPEPETVSTTGDDTQMDTGTGDVSVPKSSSPAVSDLMETGDVPVPKSSSPAVTDLMDTSVESSKVAKVPKVAKVDLPLMSQLSHVFVGVDRYDGGEDPINYFLGKYKELNDSFVDKNGKPSLKFTSDDTSLMAVIVRMAMYMAQAIKICYKTDVPYIKEKLKTTDRPQRGTLKSGSGVGKVVVFSMGEEEGKKVDLVIEGKSLKFNGKDSTHYITSIGGKDRSTLTQASDDNTFLALLCGCFCEMCDNPVRWNSLDLGN
jgi:hypothetical protein